VRLRAVSAVRISLSRLKVTRAEMSTRLGLGMPDRRVKKAFPRTLPHRCPVLRSASPTIMKRETALLNEQLGPDAGVHTCRWGESESEFENARVDSEINDRPLQPVAAMTGCQSW
jgi:hypothetical protein